MVETPVLENPFFQNATDFQVPQSLRLWLLRPFYSFSQANLV